MAPAKAVQVGCYCQSSLRLAKTVPAPWHCAARHLCQRQQVGIRLHVGTHQGGQVHKVQGLQQPQKNGNQGLMAIRATGVRFAVQQLVLQQPMARVEVHLHQALVPLVPLPVLLPHRKGLAPHLAHHILLQAL